MSQDINVLALVKGNERYIFLYDDASRSETLRTLGRYASNSELSFRGPDSVETRRKRSSRISSRRLSPGK